MAGTNAIEIRAVTKRYGEAASVLDGVSLNVAAGEFLAITDQGQRVARIVPGLCREQHREVRDIARHWPVAAELVQIQLRPR